MIINHSLAMELAIKQGDLPIGRYFTFLGLDDALASSKNHFIANRQIGKTVFSEIKCTNPTDWNFTISNKKTKLWLVFQLIGESSMTTKNGAKTETQQYRAFFTKDKKTQFHLKSGKSWLLLIGISIKDINAFGLEWGLLQPQFLQNTNLFNKVKIGYRIKNVLAQIQRTKASPFSLKYKLSAYIMQLIDTYHADLSELSKSIEHGDLALFIRAKEYIIAHYMSPEINVQKMAEELLTSERTLYRIFKENNLTVNASIQAIRIYKGREMLQRTALSVDRIAFELHFSTAKYFIKQYIKCFGHTPAMERKLIPPKELAAYRKKQQI